MYTQAILLSVLVAMAEARFGQEQIPIAAIRDVTSGGAPGEAATLAGAAISNLLGAANPCDKLVQADLIVAQLGTGADSIAAAKGLVAAEQNFNPSAVDVPTVCSDPTLPTTEVLRGIVPLVDPAVGGSDVENANSEKSIDTPFDNAGLSIADIMAAEGFSNFTTKGVDGAAGAAPEDAGNNGQGQADNQGGNVIETPVASAAACGTTLVTVTASAPATQQTANPAGGEANNGAAGNAGDADDAGNAGGAGGAGGANDFGSCDPTMSFEGGRAGRPADEFTFQSNDAAIAADQQEALNPNIITNRICDELTNICGANDAAKATCEDAQAQIEALGTRDQSTADVWNGLVGN